MTADSNNPDTVLVLSLVLLVPGIYLSLAIFPRFIFPRFARSLTCRWLTYSLVHSVGCDGMPWGPACAHCTDRFVRDAMGCHR